MCRGAEGVIASPIRYSACLIMLSIDTPHPHRQLECHQLSLDERKFFALHYCHRLSLDVAYRVMQAMGRALPGYTSG
jgi:hypothetical protein